MAMRISGLMSGMDTETIISQLVEAKRTKVNKAVKAQKSLKYKQDAWKTLNTQIKKLHTTALSNLRWEGSFVKKKTKVSNSSVVSVITGDMAMNGVQSLKVNKLAQSGSLTGGKLTRTDGEAVTGDTTLGDLGYSGGQGIFLLQNGTSADGKKPIIVDENTTISSFVGALRNAGVNANFDEANGRIYMASKASGLENDFTLRAYNAFDSMGDATSRANGAAALSFLGLQYDDQTLKSGIDNIFTSYNKKVDDIKAELDAGINPPTTTFSAQEQQLAQAMIEAGIVDGANVNGTTHLPALSGDQYDKAAVQILNGVNNITDPDLRSWAEGWMRRGQKQDASDASITLNGVEYTSSKNTFDINGLTLTVNATTAPGETVTVTTDDDTDGIYDMIKNFFKEYNSLINQMDKLYNADSAKGYEPLLDEEKEAMSDSEIEEWEKKIKDSILRKDSSLSTIANEMKTIMMQGVVMSINEDTVPPTENKMYLSQFGINTLGYFIAPENEKNAYHIDGDSDDADTSGNADKLKSMIANDPDTVVKFFTTLAKNLYDKMSEVMEGTEYSSAYTAYDDKKMQKEYDDYTVKIKELEDKLADYEDKWYAKFAAMETAMAKMQQNASAVTALLGGGM